MSRKRIQWFRRFFCASGVGALLFLPSISFAQARQQLHGHVPEVVSHLTPTGRLAPTRQLNLAVGLPLRNQAELDNFLKEVSDPNSPNYRHYLTPEQFTEKFGPTEQDYQTVENFFRTNGFAIAGEHSNRVLLDVRGSAKDVERVFHVALRTYQHPTENRTFFAPDIEPSVDLPVKLSDISGLSDFARPHPKFIQSPTNQNSGPVSKSGSGPGNTYIGNDFRATYAPGVTLNGAGQTVALVQFDNYYVKDITNYENLIGIAPANYVPLTNILLDSYNGAVGSGNPEVSLDIEMVISMSPGVSKIILYEGNPSGNNFIPNDVLNRIVNDNAASQISSSWGWSGGPDVTTEQIFKQMIAQGQTYFNASGDSDAFTNNQVDNAALPEEPSSSTNIIQVGGTMLSATNPISESAWNRNNGVGTSGGISPSNAIPSWQTNINMTANLGSTTQRNVPDVALTAENIYVKYGNGNGGPFGGTSCAAPLWAGFTALINQCATQAGQPPVGFINPAIYAIGKSANYNLDFNDVTNGNNFWTKSPTNYPAVVGYDLCTGWGTPRGSNLINALAIPDSLGILPGIIPLFLGPAGGPFNINSQNFALTNSGGSSLNWSLLGVPLWLNASSAGGALASSSGATVTVNLNSMANTFLPGVYSTNLVFTNSTSHIAQTRSIIFQPGQTLVQNGGFESPAFVPWIFNGTGGGYNFIGAGTNAIVSINGVFYIHSGTYAAFLGEAGFLDYFYEILPTIPGQSYVVSFWLRNPNGQTPNQFVMNWNTNLPATNTVLNLNNFTFTTWTNAVFVLTATGTNTMLQFGARNDNDYFGFDDVSVVPIPIPSFRTATRSNNVLSFTWNSLSNFQYRVEYSTNLSKTNWFFLSTNTAAGFTLTSTNFITNSPVRFYRIRQLP